MSPQIRPYSGINDEEQRRESQTIERRPNAVRHCEVAVSYPRWFSEASSAASTRGYGMKRHILFLIVLLASVSLPRESEAQDSDVRAQGRQTEALRIFLDCNRCDFDYLRREITFVNYVRDRRDAQVHVLVTTQPTGAGTEFTFSFIGLEEFAGNDDTHKYVSSQTDTDDEIRQGIAQVLRVGLVHYVIDTPLAEEIEITIAGRSRERQATAQPEDDPWNFWVFRAGFNGRISAEQSRTSRSISASFSANRTTENWKISLGGNGRYNDSSFELSNDRTFLTTTRNYGFNSQVVKSMGEQWGASLRASASGSTFVNQDLAISLAPGIEYNIFPYSESSRRQLTFTYEVGSTTFDYEEETIFEKTSETLFDESLIVSLSMRQPWGTSSVSMQASHYLHDFGKYSAVFFGFLDFRITRGLSVNFFGDGSLIRNQLYLPKEGFTDEEILVQRRQLATSYRYSIFFGLSYTFGSIYNNVVNPRFGGSRGGIIRFF